MHHPWTSTLASRRPRRSVIAATGAAALLAGLAGCASDGGDEQGTQGDPKADVETSLDQAQLVQFGDAKVDPEQSEQGTFSELEATKQKNDTREGTNLDKPDCVDAVDRWSRMPEVKEAPASLATYPRGEDIITHTLIEIPQSAAKEAVETQPPEECSTYKATLDDGTTTDYTLRDLDLETVGDGSRAFVAEAASGGESMHVYYLVYRNMDHFAEVTLLGEGEDPKHEEALLEFSKAAVEREEQVLG